MKKKIFIVTALLLSTNIYAATNQNSLGSNILNAIQNPSHLTSLRAAFPLVYGGKDISRSVIATADESLWTGDQRTLVG